MSRIETNKLAELHQKCGQTHEQLAENAAVGQIYTLLRVLHARLRQGVRDNELPPALRFWVETQRSRAATDSRNDVPLRIFTPDTLSRITKSLPSRFHAIVEIKRAHRGLRKSQMPLDSENITDIHDRMLWERAREILIELQERAEKMLLIIVQSRQNEQDPHETSPQMLPRWAGALAAAGLFFPHGASVIDQLIPPLSQQENDEDTTLRLTRELIDSLIAHMLFPELVANNHTPLSVSTPDNDEIPTHPEQELPPTPIPADQISPEATAAAQQVSRNIEKTITIPQAFLIAEESNLWKSLAVQIPVTPGSRVVEYVLEVDHKMLKMRIIAIGDVNTVYVLYDPEDSTPWFTVQPDFASAIAAAQKAEVSTTEVEQESYEIGQKFETTLFSNEPISYQREILDTAEDEQGRVIIILSRGVEDGVPYDITPSLEFSDKLEATAMQIRQNLAANMIYGYLKRDPEAIGKANVPAFIQERSQLMATLGLLKEDDVEPNKILASVVAMFESGRRFPPLSLPAFSNAFGDQMIVDLNKPIELHLIPTLAGKIYRDSSKFIDITALATDLDQAALILTLGVGEDGHIIIGVYVNPAGMIDKNGNHLRDYHAKFISELLSGIVNRWAGGRTALGAAPSSAGSRMPAALSVKSGALESDWLQESR